MFSNRIQDLKSSPIREILSVINQPGMISFAGGLPASESFPSLSLHNIPNSALQYGASEGDEALRIQVAQEMAAIGLHCKPEQVLILSGSQQGLDLVAKLMIDQGTQVAVESPTYLAALQVFGFFGAKFVPITASVLPNLTYAIPSFQNPSGHCMSLAQRQDLARRCDQSNSLLLEDDPYRDLVYDDCHRTPVCAWLKSAPWVYLGSFSKTMLPGLRLGFLVASENLITPLTRLKQAADLHSNRLSQWLVLGLLQHPERTQRMAQLIANYRHKRDAFDDRLKHYFSEFANWDTPAGGLFYWITLKETNKGKTDTRALLPRAIEQGVAFMPGEPFMPFSSSPTGQIRLNFSHASEAQMDAGLKKLAAIFQS